MGRNAQMVGIGATFEAVIGGADAGGKSVFELKVPSFPGSLRVISFRGRERISKLFSFEVLVLAPAATDFAEAAVVGQRASFSMQVPGSEGRQIHGVVAAIEREGTTIAMGYHSYRIRLVPTFWRLKKRVTSRIFQNKTVPEIIASVLD